MYVKIGPYVPWWRSRICTDYMDKKYNYQWDEPTTFFEKFLDKVEDLMNWFYHYTFNKYFSRMERKIVVKIDDYDVWGLDNTLAHIILPALKLLNEKKQGTPFTDDEDVPVGIRSVDAKPKENEWDTDEFIETRWEYIINEMIHAFECELDETWEDQFATGDLDIRWKKETPDDKFSTMVYGPNHTYKVDNDAKKKAWERRQNGLRLFGKYYHNLWT